MKLLYKIRITGTLTVETGLHIGGSEVELEIGGIDNAVIKNSANGEPYIPGSSLKGKMRQLLATDAGSKTIDEDVNTIFVLFGDGVKDKKRNGGNLIFRDSFFSGTTNNTKTILEEKSENRINRVDGSALPRHIERVVVGAQFGIDLILNIMESFNVRDKVTVYKSGANKETYDPHYINQGYSDDFKISLLDTIKKGFRLLENDYLGGSGTRGYGKVSFILDTPRVIRFNKNGTITEEPMNDYNFNI